MQAAKTGLLLCLSSTNLIINVVCPPIGNIRTGRYEQKLLFQRRIIGWTTDSFRNAAESDKAALSDESPTVAFTTMRREELSITVRSAFIVVLSTGITTERGVIVPGAPAKSTVTPPAGAGFARDTENPMGVPGIAKLPLNANVTSLGGRTGTM
jgi:hypothetical protein